MTNTATAAQFNRQPSKFLRAAKCGVTTEVTDHGHVAAALIPQPEITPGDVLARALRETRPAAD